MRKAKIVKQKTQRGTVGVLTDAVLEELAELHEKNARRPWKRLQQYYRDVEAETASAIRELIQLRRSASIRVEGSVS